LNSPHTHSKLSHPETLTRCPESREERERIGAYRSGGSSDDSCRWPVAATTEEWFSERLGSTRQVTAPTKTEGTELSSRCVNSSNQTQNPNF